MCKVENLLLIKEHACSVHFRALDVTTQNTTTDADPAGERTFVVNIVAKNGVLRGLESQTHLLPIALLTLGIDELPYRCFARQENAVLLVENPIVKSINLTPWRSGVPRDPNEDK